MENWQPLRQVRYLYMPVPIRDNATAHTTYTAGVLDQIDLAGRSLYPDFRVADVFLSPQTSHRDFKMARFSTAELLERLVKNPFLQGVTFHASGDSASSSYTLYRFAVARLLGLLEDESAQIQDSEYLLAHDQLFLSLHRAAQARETQEAFHSFFQYEISALLGLGLYEHAANYTRWAAMEAPEQITAYEAHLHAVHGDTIAAMAVLETASLRDWKWRLEEARTLLLAGEPEAALLQFESCLTEKPDHFDPLLGKAICLRAIAWPTSDRALLLQASACLGTLCSYSGYHSAEAFHHRGTIHMALEDYATAEELFRKTLELAISPLTRRNLALVLHAQHKTKESYEHFSYLYRNFPAFTEGLEKHFPQRPKLMFQTGQPPLFHENSDARIEAIRASLKKQRVHLKGELLDFKRIDSFINYYAPGGCFIQHNASVQFSDEELAELFADIARCLAHTLVASNHAFWASSPKAPGEQLRLATCDEHGQPTVFFPFHSLLERLREGAESDARLTLESLVTHLPEVQEELEYYVDPYPALPADEQRVEVFESRAARVPLLLEEFGYFLNGNLEDLFILDEVVDALLSTQTTIGAARADAAFGNNELIDIGLYLGNLCRQHAGGLWYDHHEGFGISVQEMSVSNMYPVWKVFKRMASGIAGDGFSNISALYPSLTCASLLRELREDKIPSLEVVCERLQARLPQLSKEGIRSLAARIIEAANGEKTAL